MSKMCNYYRNGVCMDTDGAKCDFAEDDGWDGCRFYSCDEEIEALAEGLSEDAISAGCGEELLRVVYLPVERIDHHPDNPRKAVGDVNELAESIRAEGIQQPLTVIPSVAGEPGRYTAVIGHRRLEAAKKAGLRKVPAFVREMTRREQLRTMMTENTQRENLTPLEEADGFQQIMLELPEQTAAAVARETGFSETTVRRRMRLLELPREAVEEAETRGVTLGDYEKLNRIRDPERKARALETAGTDAFEQTVKHAIEQEEKLRHKERLLRELEGLGCLETTTTVGMDSVRWVCEYSWKAGELAADWAKDWTDCCYRTGDTWIQILRKKKELPKAADEKTKAEERERRRLKAVEEMDGLHAEMEQMVHEFRLSREDFVGSFDKWERCREEIMAFAVRMMLSQGYGVDLDALADWLGIERGKTGLEEQGLRRLLRLCPEKVLLYTAYWMAEGKYRSYTQLDGRDYELNTKKVYHQKDERTDALYAALGELGYLMTGDEQKWQRGELLQYARAKEIASGWKKD